ncbi:MAG: ArsA family ATPase [Deltaproteobacteria bacterium]|nr:ArsA family ATPase [Deltaproteobacteria bacterium]
MGKKKQIGKTSPLPDARIILFTGKGGVGKTSVAAASAVRCAESGLGTLIMSTDAAHSLSDSFDLPVGSKPTLICKRLWAQEINVNEQISSHWGSIHEFLMQFLKRRGFDSVIADELAIPPGIEEIFSLLALMEHALDERFKVVIIDCAPTADTARLLAVPDIIQWYMEKIFHIERAVIRTVRPVAKRLTDAPLPPDEVFESVEKLYHKIIGVKDLLTDRTRTSIRMVVNPEKMVIKEAQRAYTVMNLFDFGLDAVIINRVLPEEVKDPYYDKWRKIQAEHIKVIESSFQPLPILCSPLWDQEIYGLELLSKFAKKIYYDVNPADLFYKGRPVSITPVNGRCVMEISMPFAERDDMETWIKGDELTIKFKNFKRNLILPRGLANHELVKAEFKGRSLKLIFEGEKDAQEK